MITLLLNLGIRGIQGIIIIWVRLDINTLKVIS